MGDLDAVALSVSTGSPRAELSLHELRVLGVLLQGLLEGLVPEENLSARPAAPFAGIENELLSLEANLEAIWREFGNLEGEKIKLKFQIPGI